MSDTTRAVQHGWGPGYQAFDEWNGKRPPAKRVKSVKHQKKDRKGIGKEGGEHGRFSKHGKNSRYNLVRKNEDAMEQEQEP